MRKRKEAERRIDVLQETWNYKGTTRSLKDKTLKICALKSSCFVLFQREKNIYYTYSNNRVRNTNTA